MFQAIKDYFYNSGTLMTSAGAMVVGALGAGAAALDYNQMLDSFVSSGFNWKVVAAASVPMFIQGAWTYITRLRGTAVVQVAGKPVLAPAVPTTANVKAVEGKAAIVKK